MYDTGSDITGFETAVAVAMKPAACERRQTTVAAAVRMDGVGLHSGAAVSLVFRPAPADAGVVFRRVDLLADSADEDRLRRVTVRATAGNVGATQLGTTIENAYGASVATVEHLMAAVAGLGLDNLLVEIDGPEVPIMDGSAEPFLAVLRKAGLASLNAPAAAPRLTRKVALEQGASRLVATPADAFEIEVEIDFEDPAIGAQTLSMTVTPDAFAADVADARTFCLKRDIDRMRAAGLARGGSLDNAIVVADGEILNEGGLRRADEFVVHKALDMIGDLRLVGALPKMKVRASRPGHAINTAFAKLLLEAKGALDWGLAADLDEDAAPVPAKAAI